MLHVPVRFVPVQQVEEAVPVLRRTLAEAEDLSITYISVGLVFFLQDHLVQPPQVPDQPGRPALLAPGLPQQDGRAGPSAPQGLVHLAIRVWQEYFSISFFFLHKKNRKSYAIFSFHTMK